MRDDRHAARGGRAVAVGLLAVSCVLLGLAPRAAGAAAAGARAGSGPAIAQPLLTFDQKMAWILMLEDRRVLRDAAPFPTPPPPAQPPPCTSSKSGKGPSPFGTIASHLKESMELFMYSTSLIFTNDSSEYGEA